MEPLQTVTSTLLSVKQPYQAYRSPNQEVNQKTALCKTQVWKVLEDPGQNHFFLTLQLSISSC